MAIYIGNKLVSGMAFGQFTEAADTPMSRPLHIDENLKWVCPDDWDDPYNGGGTPVTKVENVVYVVIRTDVTLPFYSYKVNVAYTAETGHFVNGAFVSLSSTSMSANGIFQGVLTSDYATSGKNTIVLKFSSTSNITSFTAPAYTYNSKSLGSNYIPCVIRYGNIKYATEIPYCHDNQEVEDMLHCRGNIVNLYINRRMLKKIRVEGIKFSSPSFTGCTSLIDHDFEKLDLTNCSNLGNVFNGCDSLTSIDVSEWYTDNITTIAGCFASCGNLKELKGIENWDMSRCTSFYQAFYSCRSLCGELDMSSWGVVMGTNSMGFSNMFSGCYRLNKVNISNWNVASCVRADGMFQNCYSLEEVIADDCIASVDGVGSINNLNNIFSNDSNLRTIGGIVSWFENATSFSQSFYGCRNLESIDFSDVSLTGESASNAIFNLFAYCYGTKRINISTLDMSKFTYNGAQFDLFNNCNALEELYPPQNICWNMSLSASIHLSHDSIIRLFNNLTTPKGTTTAQKTITLGAINLAKLTADEMAIATDKGWTLA